MKKLSLLTFIILSISFVFSVFKGPEDETHQTKFNENYAIFSLNQPEQIGFSGEKMPLDQQDIRERFDRELLVNTYWQSQTVLFIKKANKYFPVIEPILKKNGIPDDFKYLAIAESGLANIVSPSGATGFWQIMKATGKENGLLINNEIDERYHLVKSTQAACNYLNEAYLKFGSWTLAAASYNMGMTGLSKQMKRQNASNYYDLLLNSETARYVFRISAIKEILKNQKTYGFHIREKDLYTLAPLHHVLLDSSVNNFALYAKDLNINYKILKEYNPWLRQSDLKNQSDFAYFIDIPKVGFFTSKNKTELIEDVEINSSVTRDTVKIEIN
ncbi:MAG: lytic transglycosylase domain-containing protein [Flavobacteriales bacterium]|jgi:membrane-bound lytic murein transglycosylase D|tara:strand:+ start:2405 stop:3394 length:990 start_codon:yes stop_codon:yes gene_type:complete